MSELIRMASARGSGVPPTTRRIRFTALRPDNSINVSPKTYTPCVPGNRVWLEIEMHSIATW